MSGVLKKLSQYFSALQFHPQKKKKIKKKIPPSFFFLCSFTDKKIHLSCMTQKNNYFFMLFQGIQEVRKLRSKIDVNQRG